MPDIADRRMSYGPMLRFSEEWARYRTHMAGAPGSTL